MNCNNKCNRLCERYIISNSLTIVSVNGIDTLVVDIPNGNYANKENYCLIIAQNRPAEATVDMPVAVSINGDTTTVYPLVCDRTCLQATACQISGRTKIKTIVQTNTASGVFRALCGLGVCCSTMLQSLPAPAAAATPAVFAARSTAAKTTKATTAKEVQA